jgi:hypothetical protein
MQMIRLDAEVQHAEGDAAGRGERRSCCHKEALVSEGGHAGGGPAASHERDSVAHGPCVSDEGRRGVLARACDPRRRGGHPMFEQRARVAQPLAPYESGYYLSHDSKPVQSERRPTRPLPG